jgi:hypothetical protein
LPLATIGNSQKTTARSLFPTRYAFAGRGNVTGGPPNIISVTAITSGLAGASYG